MITRPSRAIAPVAVAVTELFFVAVAVTAFVTGSVIVGSLAAFLAVTYPVAILVARNRDGGLTPVGWDTYMREGGNATRRLRVLNAAVVLCLFFAIVFAFGSLEGGALELSAIAIGLVYACFYAWWFRQMRKRLRLEREHRDGGSQA